MQRKTALLASLMLTLSACSRPSAPTLEAPTPANLLTACPQPHVFDGTTADDLVGDYIDLVALYRDCATRHNALSR